MTWICGLLILSSDLNGEYETPDNKTLSYEIENLQGCLDCEVTVSARTSAGYGPKDVQRVNTMSGNVYRISKS